MPGGKGNRTKGNVKPSSSSRAAELLTQSGSAPAGFIGFGAVSGTQAYVPASQAFDDVDTCLDSDFRVVLRKLTKRDATTKIKALGEFSTLCREKDDSALQAVLPFWPRLYNKIAIDADAKVREYAQSAMETLVNRVRRSLARYLKNIMGAWILSCNDTYPTVASAAHKSFNSAFPGDKRENAVIFCKVTIMEYMVDNLLNQTSSTLSDPKTTEKKEMEAKYMRVLSSSLMGLRQLLLVLPAAQLDDDLKGHLRKLLNESKFWNLSKTSQILVRSGLYWFLGSLCQKVPEVAGDYVSKLSPVILGNVDVLEPGLTAALWDSVLSLIKFVPTCWEKIDWQKAFWPKLKKLLDSGSQGNATCVAPCLLPLLCCIQVEKAGGAAAFFPKFMEHFKQGFAKDSIVNSPSESSAWSKAFVECFQYSFSQISDEGSAPAVLQAMFLDQLIPVIEASFFDAKPTLSHSLLYHCVSAFLRRMETDARNSKLYLAFWTQLTEDLVEKFETVIGGGKPNVWTDRLVWFIKALLYPQSASHTTAATKEKVRFAAKESRPLAKVSTPQAVEISEEMKTFVKEMLVYSHKLYQKDQSCAHLKLFVDLANLYFPADIAEFVLHSLEDSEKKEGRIMVSGEINLDAHSNLIGKVVLPILAEKEKDENSTEIVDHTITLLFACLPYLSPESSTVVWDSVLQTARSTSSLCSLIERALEKRQVMPQVSTWLSSSHLHSRLQNLIAILTTQHATTHSAEIEMSWKVICLVLSANDDNEPVFPSSWIVDVVSSVYHELVALGSCTLLPQEAQLAIQFVARAALTFFQNLKMSLCLNEGRDVIVALMRVDLDSGIPKSEREAGSSILRQSWTAGLGLAVQETGGFLCEGGMLVSACHVIRETLLTKTQSLEQYRLAIEVTEELLKIAKSHLPNDSDDDSGEQYNSVLIELLSELVIPTNMQIAENLKIFQFLSLNGHLPLTALEEFSSRNEDNMTSLTTLVFSSLFNVHLLHCYQSGLRFGAEELQTDTRVTFVWKREDDVILDAVRNVFLASTWQQMDAEVSSEFTHAVDELKKNTHACFLSSFRNSRHQNMEKAFVRINDDVVSALSVGQLMHLLWSQEEGEKDFFQQFFSERMESIENSAEVFVVYLPCWKLLEMLRIQAAVLSSITPESLSAAAPCLRVMRACVNKEPHAIMLEHADLLTSVISNLTTLQDDHLMLYLFSCDISEEPLWKIEFNISTMQFLTAVVNAFPSALTPELWDFILCSSVSWTESLNNSRVALSSSVSLQTFCVEDCHLLAAIGLDIQQKLPLLRESFPSNLETEWKEFFAEGIYSFLFPLFIKMLEDVKVARKGEAGVIMRAFGSAMSQCPKDQLMGHKLPPKLLVADDTSPLPDSVQTLLNHLLPGLICPLAPAQLTAFVLLDKIISSLSNYHKDQAGGDSAGASAEMESRSPPAGLVKVIEDCAAAMDVVLIPCTIEDTVTLVSGSEAYQFGLGYMLAWQLLLHLFQSASAQGRAEYASYLREHSSVERFLTHLFCLMPTSPFSSPADLSLSKPDPNNSHLVSSPLESSRPSRWLGSSFIPLTAENIGKSADIQHVSCCVYMLCLEVIPVLVRKWWKDQDRKSSAFIDKFTTKYFSPQLIQSEMNSINSSESVVKDLTVKGNSITRQVTAVYTTEELKAEIQITLPESYPLGEITVDSQRHAVIKQTQWERMLLQLTIFLQHQNGTIVEGLRVWKRNIEKRIEGVEECFICYAVIHATTCDLPRVPCRTCKKKFHSACLYKWLNSSQNATCPLCRSFF